MVTGAVMADAEIDALFSQVVKDPLAIVFLLLPVGTQLFVHFVDQSCSLIMLLLETLDHFFRRSLVAGQADPLEKQAGENPVYFINLLCRGKIGAPIRGRIAGVGEKHHIRIVIVNRKLVVALFWQNAKPYLNKFAVRHLFQVQVHPCKVRQIPKRSIQLLNFLFRVVFPFQAFFNIRSKFLHVFQQNTIFFLRLAVGCALKAEGMLDLFAGIRKLLQRSRVGVILPNRNKGRCIGVE